MLAVVPGCLQKNVALHCCMHPCLLNSLTVLTICAICIAYTRSVQLQQPLSLLCASRAPEQMAFDGLFGLPGSHTDVWGFATTVLHLATGHLPYQGLTHLHIMYAMFNRRLPPQVPSSLPGWLQKALTSCLSFDTAARPSVLQLYQVRCVRIKHLFRHSLICHSNLGHTFCRPT